MPIQFDPATMSTGIVEIDEQHKKIIAGLNDLVAALSKGQGALNIGKTIDFLGQYARQHFAHEEQCMSSYKCPVALTNKFAHEKFLRVFTALKTRFDTEGPNAALALDVQRQLSDWIASHIKQTDV